MSPQLLIFIATSLRPPRKYVANNQLGLRCMMLQSWRHLSTYWRQISCVPKCTVIDLLQLYCMCTHHSEFLLSGTIYSTQPETV
ncbi:hypothetical protein [Diadegma fenestrale ichnovirus]|nr:hypothetical protein [Diadegma fenestrale ichnovirus]